MEKLAKPGNDAASDIRQRLEEDGGEDIRLDGADISSGITPEVASARLRGRTTAGSYEERLTMTRKDDRWHVVLGAAPSDPAKPTAGHRVP